MIITQHDFLTPEEFARAEKTVHDLRSYWFNCASGFVPFFTLGAASYRDAVGGDINNYQQRFERLNPVLIANFSFLYEKLTARLASILKMPVELAENKAVPGFHIFLSNKLFEKPMAGAHFDLQFNSLKWDNYRSVDFDHPISITCGLKLPKSKAGMNYWQITHEEAKKLSEEELIKLKKNTPSSFFPYDLGKLVLQQGLIWHQMAPVKDIQPDDERITLQGHGLLCDGVMRLYW